MLDEKRRISQIEFLPFIIYRFGRSILIIWIKWADYEFSTENMNRIESLSKHKYNLKWWNVINIL